MKRSYLKNLYLKKRADHSLRNNKEQKTISADSTKKKEKNFF